jgi:hypothetical protein
MPAVLGGGGDSDATRLIKPDVTPTPPKTRFWDYRTLTAAAVILVVLGAGLFFLLGSGPGKKPPTTTTSTSSTTTTIPPGSAALNALKSQVLAGEAAGNVDDASGRTIAQQAGLAQAAYVAGKTQQAAIDLELAASAIQNGVSNHLIGPVEGQLLQSDLALFAGALGLSSAVTTTTTSTSTTTTSTTTTTTTLPGSPFGNGNGNGPGN